MKVVLLFLLSIGASFIPLVFAECPANEYGSGGECLPCPSHSTSPPNSTQLADCTCFHGYRFHLETSTCDVVTCPPLSENGNTFPTTHHSQNATGTCQQDYVIYNGHLPDLNRRPVATCVLADDGRSAFWMEPLASCEATCALSPCQNGGICHSGTTCLCPSNQGRLCESPHLLTCSHLTCLNGGTCIPGIEGSTPATCACSTTTSPGFQGLRCERSADGNERRVLIGGGALAGIVIGAFVVVGALAAAVALYHAKIKRLWEGPGFGNHATLEAQGGHS